MKLGFKKGEKGFTLIELMVVMAIIAVLAAVVMPAITGTKQISINAQVSQDASATETATSNYNANANLAEALVTATPNVLDETTTQITSNKWPEITISAGYDVEFRAAAIPGDNLVIAVNIVSKNGTTLYATDGATNKKLADFVTAYTALNIDTLLDEGYLPEKPSSIDLLFSTTKAYHNYLWLLNKGFIEGEDAGSTGGRALEIFSLITIDDAGSNGDTLTYKRIY